MKKGWFKTPYKICAALSWIVFAISFFLPAVYVSRDLFGGLYVGWRIFLMTTVLGCLLNPGALLLTCCNLLMLGSPFLLKRAAKNRSLIPALWMLGAVVSNFTPWLWDEKIEFHVGYYVWCSSFILAVVALVLASRDHLRPSYNEDEEPYQRGYSRAEV